MMKAIVSGLVCAILLSIVVIFVAVPMVNSNMKGQGQFDRPTFGMRAKPNEWLDRNGKHLEGPTMIESYDSGEFPIGNNEGAIIASRLKITGKMPKKAKDEEYLLILAPQNVQVGWQGKKFDWVMTLPPEGPDPMTCYMFIVPKALTDQHNIDLNVLEGKQKAQTV